MQSSLQIPTNSNRAKFPLSSPSINDLASPLSARTGLTHRSREPSQSPYSDQGNPFADDESDTSGQDEFHLERYSQPTEKTRRDDGNEMKLPSTRYRERGESPRKRPRPGLNIITDFPGDPVRLKTKKIVLDEVPNQKPRLGSRTVASVISQKAEHFNYAAEKIAPSQPGFVSLHDITNLKKSKAADSKVKVPFKNTSNHTKRLAASNSSRQGSDISPAPRSIVIGISVPEDQAEHHNPKDLNSALSLYTPATPQIIVTPAQDGGPWSKPEVLERKKPASSLYSQLIHNERHNLSDDSIPPVPYLKKGDTFHSVTQNQSDPRSKAILGPGANHRPLSIDTVFDDEDDIADPGNRQRTADTDEDTVPLTGDPTRPKSKGWWDLALTPMLSRAGTVFARKSPTETSPVPPVPSKSPFMRTQKPVDIDFEEPLLSPETPRRIGMGSSRASTAAWTNWTEWEDQRNRGQSTTQTSENEDWKGHKAQDSGATVPFMFGATPITKGLAAEYFQACAFDQRGSEPYFECLNHSCSEKLPRLGSSRAETRGMLLDVPSTKPDNKTARDLALEKLQGNEPVTERTRSGSDSTVIDEDPAEFSPNMRHADVATIVKPTAFQPTKLSDSKDVDPILEETKYPSKASNAIDEVKSNPVSISGSRPPQPAPKSAPRLVAVDPETNTGSRQPLASPGPLSPAAQRDIAPQGAVPMSDVREGRSVQDRPQPTFINMYTTYPERPVQTDHAPMPIGDLERQREFPPPPQAESSEKPEKEQKNYFGWLSCLGRKKEDDPEKKKKRRRTCLIFWGLLGIVIACVVLALTLMRKGDNTPVNSQWLNLTGFPPMPTGISTLIRPDVLNADNSCVHPSTLWSCAVPKEQASNISPNDPDQPNFRFEIRFHNGTSGVNPADTIPLNGTGATSSAANDPFANSLFTPNPTPPSDKEQIFLGNTTDNISEPFDGVVTPFFITFVSAFPVVPNSFTSSSTTKRSLNTRQTNSNNTLTLPSPATTSGGLPAPAQLLPSSPFPSSQPLRLYNRGLPSEHYGFYIYYDKTLFLSTTSVTNVSAGGNDVLPDDQNGGSFLSSATAMCTFSQTRFLVKIFTSPSSGLSLLGSSTSTVAGNDPNNSAFDYNPPGSFPYPMSVTLDRHGGDDTKKAVFCYEMLDGQFVQPLTGVLQAEFRGAGGSLINSPESIVVGASSTNFDSSLGGVDGGTGGCKCNYGNFVGTPS